MVSRSRSDVRRNYIGVVRRGCSIRTKGHFSVRENLPAYGANPTCTVVVGIPHRIPRYRPSFGIGAYAGTQLLSRAMWMNPTPGFILKGGHVCSIDRAEKSRRPRRRKRGLRKGKSRSRGRHPRRSSPDRQALHKTPSDRKVNHSGRKFIWAVMASNKLRKVCEKYNKFPRGLGSFPDPPINPSVLRARRSLKQHCMAVWTRLHRRATIAGLHPTVAFHESFWRYLMVETTRGNRGAVEDLFFLAAGLPGDPEIQDEFVRGPRLFNPDGSATANRRGGRGSSVPKRYRGVRPLRRR